MAAWLDMTITEDSVDITNNSSKITVKVYLKTDGSTRNVGQSVVGSSLVINGILETYTFAINVPYNSTQLIATMTRTIPHANDGTKTVSVTANSVQVTSKTTASAITRTKTLTAIQRATLPTSISLSSPYGVPNQDITFSWSGATASDANPIIGYNILINDDEPIEVAADISSYSYTIPANIERGSTLRFRIQTISSTYTTDPSEARIAKINIQPTLNINNYPSTILSTQNSIQFSFTASDPDYVDQTLITQVRRKLTNTTYTSWETITSPYSLDCSELSGEIVLEFCVNDGYESVIQNVTFVKNVRPVLTVDTPIIDYYQAYGSIDKYSKGMTFTCHANKTVGVIAATLRFQINGKSRVETITQPADTDVTFDLSNLNPYIAPYYNGTAIVCGISVTYNDGLEGTASQNVGTVEFPDSPKVSGVSVDGQNYELTVKGYKEFYVKALLDEELIENTTQVTVTYLTETGNSVEEKLIPEITYDRTGLGYAYYHFTLNYEPASEAYIRTSISASNGEYEKVFSFYGFENSLQEFTFTHPRVNLLIANGTFTELNPFTYSGTVPVPFRFASYGLQNQSKILLQLANNDYSNLSTVGEKTITIEADSAGFYTDMRNFYQWNHTLGFDSYVGKKTIKVLCSRQEEQFNKTIYLAECNLILNFDTPISAVSNLNLQYKVATDDNWATFNDKSSLAPHYLQQNLYIKPTYQFSYYNPGTYTVDFAVSRDNGMTFNILMSESIVLPNYSAEITGKPQPGIFSLNTGSNFQVSELQNDTDRIFAVRFNGGNFLSFDKKYLAVKHYIPNIYITEYQLDEDNKTLTIILNSDDWGISLINNTNDAAIVWNYGDTLPQGITNKSYNNSLKQLKFDFNDWSWDSFETEFTCTTKLNSTTRPDLNLLTSNTKTVVLPPFRLFNSIPLLSPRKGQIGVNSRNFASDDIIVIGGDNIHNKIRFVDRTGENNLGVLENFTIDCGSWS